MAEYPKLGSLQTKVLCYVAENNPSSMMSVAVAVAGRNMYKNVREIIIKFETDQYIKKDEEKSYYPTQPGINTALLNGANPKKIRTHLNKFFTDIQLDSLLLACDVAEHPKMGLDTLRLFNKTTDSILTKRQFPLIGLPLDPDSLDDFLVLLKKYPRIYDRVPKLLRMALDYIG